MARPQSSLASMARLAQVKRQIPGGTSTNARSSDRLVPPHTPNFTVSAHGAEFIDDDGRTWIDCDMGLAAVVWGHARPEIDDAVIAQIKKGVLFSTPPLLEGQAAELILTRLQVFSALRFVKTGADAVSGAIRLARAATGKNSIITSTYHGWHDWSAYPHYGGSEVGVPDQIGHLSRRLPAENAVAVEQLLNADVAAIVVCPEHWQPDQLIKVVQLCHANGCVVIFDEIKSGLRVGPRGCWGKIGIVPDLLCLSKGLANGYPLGALVGNDSLMGLALKIKLSSTYATECLGLAASIAAERLLASTKSWPSWENFIVQLCIAVNQVIDSSKTGGRTLRVFEVMNTLYIQTPDVNLIDDPFRPALIRGLAQRGIFTTGNWITLSDAHNVRHLATIQSALTEVVSEWLNS